MLEADLPGGGVLDGGEVTMKEVEDIMRRRVEQVRSPSVAEPSTKNTLADAILLPLADAITAA